MASEIFETIIVSNSEHQIFKNLFYRKDPRKSSVIFKSLYCLPVSFSSLKSCYVAQGVLEKKKLPY